jgi:hypothetical protein
MCFLFSFLPATFWVVIGYFVLFSSSKAGEGIRAFGRILAIWIFVIAACFLLAGAYVSASGLCPDFSRLHSSMMSTPAQ